MEWEAGQVLNETNHEVCVCGLNELLELDFYFTQHL